MSDKKDVTINMGGKQVPFNKINKPHNVVIQPHHHQPETKDFPDLEPQAKEREAQLNKPHDQFIHPDQHHVNVKDFPDLEPQAKAREAAREAELNRKDE